MKLEVEGDFIKYALYNAASVITTAAFFYKVF